MERAQAWGCPRHPKVIFKDNQEPKLGDAPDGIPSFVFVHRYLYLEQYFIHHMICVLLGASFSFVSFCFLLVRIVFFLFSFNKKVKDSLCHAYFASLHVAV